jgi:hypothetical protein
VVLLEVFELPFLSFDTSVPRRGSAYLPLVALVYQTTRLDKLMDRDPERKATPAAAIGYCRILLLAARTSHHLGKGGNTSHGRRGQVRALPMLEDEPAKAEDANWFEDDRVLVPSRVCRAGGEINYERAAIRGVAGRELGV